MADAIIQIKNLSKHFGKKVAVNNISFEVMPKSIFGLLGPNGSGKTTTLRMLVALLVPTAGSIKIESLDYFKDAQKIREDIGYVPQKDAIYSTLKVWENVDFFFSAYKYDGDRKARIDEVLRDVDLLDAKNELAKNLSGGMLKRLSIACAIVHKPKIIFFDEVTMGLDPVARQMIWDLIFELKNKATVILTTHYMDEAQALCDRLAILRDGRILANGSPVEIVEKYKAKNLHDVMIKVQK